MSEAYAENVSSSASEVVDLPAKSLVLLGQTASGCLRGRSTAAFEGGAALGRLARLEPRE
jgi:hypothetical protein